MAPPPVPFETVTDAAQLTDLLGNLFEPTDSLRKVLVPAVQFRASTNPPKTYSDLVDLCEAIGDEWDWETKADFIQGHPVVGEVKLSGHSLKEQGLLKTPEVVLNRLAHLNNAYESVFPGLRFITFVAGRTRAVIVNEMEQTIGIETSPQPLPDNFPTNEPALGSPTLQKFVRPKLSEAWKTECTRCLKDIFRIGHARLQNMGLE